MAGDGPHEAGSWRSSPVPPPLGDRPHVWRADLDSFAAEETLLSEAERARARRFAFAEDRRRFLAQHGWQRRLLGLYTGRAPETLRIEPDAMGKPRLADVPLPFNGSESGGVALFAVSASGDIGVDVESLRPERADPRFAHRYFHPEEAAKLDRLDGEAFARAFFMVWTRKEALVKAVGLGLRIPLASFRVGVLPDEPAGPLGFERDWPAGREWRLLSLPLGSRFAGAIALPSALPDPLLLQAPDDPTGRRGS